MTTLTLYRGAKRPAPIRVDEIPDWPETVASITELCERSAPTKLELLAFGPHRLRPGGKRCNADVEAVSLLVIDVDRCNASDLVTALAEAGTAALIYGSPSDDPDGPDDARRVRVVGPVSREMTPAECGPARLAFAEMLGLAPGAGVEKCLAPAQLFFAGRLEGTAPRNVAEVPGAPVDVDALLARPLVHDWHATAAAEAAPAAATGDVDAELAERLDRAADACEGYYVPGERHALGRALAAFCRHHGVPQCGAEALLVELAERTGSDAAAAIARARWTYSAAALNPAGASALPAALLAELDRIGLGDDWTLRALQSHGAEAAPARPPSLGPLILQLRGDGGSVFLDEGPDRGGYQPVALDVLPMALQEIGQGGLGVDGKRKLSPRALVERHGRIVREAVTDFAAAASHYDPERERLVMGLPQACTTAPAFDAAADAWLHALAGAKHAALAEWIAGTHRRHITRPAAALALIGQHSIGKTLLAAALARLWGALEPVPMAAVVVTFNASMATCPIVIDDECAAHKRRLISTADFRALVQSRVRHYEPKGRERRPLLGAQRFVLTANDPAQIAFTDSAGSEAVAAIAERLLVIDCGDALDALHALRGADGEIDFERLCGHLAWLQATVSVPDARQRFIGADPDREAALRAALAHAATRTPEVWESLEQWLDAAAPREGGPWLCCARSLCVDPQALASTLAASGARVDLAAVRAALDPVRALDARRGKVSVRPRGDDPARRRVWALNVERVAAALGWSDEQRAAVAARVGASDEDDEG